MEFFRQESWSGLPFPSPEDLPNPGIEPGPPALQADSLLSEPPGLPLVEAGVQIKIAGQLLHRFSALSLPLVKMMEKEIFKILTHIDKEMGEDTTAEIVQVNPFRPGSRSGDRGH